ncbi:hypothetical protein [Bradyrhizobium sp. JYMT SZCCT0428]|uniref:hypothetical protein n=1 Tax=Bradyrhizobium sp. JYMT SZCCT0428 TaxID=2807673 RepID=UPI002011FC3C|nr:hypothetical protein [Bradyrhizobium sp. JYMT SZCCT0428]
MYLAKFFHRPPGDDDRELLLVLDGDPIILGILMREDLEPGEDQYLRDEFSDMETAVAAFRRHAAELVASGYIETTHTDYTLRNLLPDPEPKPDWQKGLDELMLAALGESLEAQAKLLAALRDTPAADEPLYLLLAAITVISTIRTMKGSSSLPNADATPSCPAVRPRRRITPGQSGKATSRPARWKY